MNSKGPTRVKTPRGDEAPTEKQSEQTPKRIPAKMKSRIVQHLMRRVTIDYHQPSLRAIRFSNTSAPSTAQYFR